jgi:7-cyano-7-deazaguanine synthase
MKAIVLTSGGIDSTVTLYYALKAGYRVHALAFNYGQRHHRELRSAGQICNALECPLNVVDLKSLAALLGGSALTDRTIDVPEGDYRDASMRITVVPNRNAVFLSIAYAVAVAEKAEVVFVGVHAGDHPIYPDCRPDFMDTLEHAFQLGNLGMVDPPVRISTPFIRDTKAAIVKAGAALHVPFELTWSCYKGGSTHCGRCGTCVERHEAFELAKVADPTVYNGDALWVQGTNQPRLPGVEN